MQIPVHAETASKTEALKAATPVKQSPEALFLKGQTCLKQQDSVCAKVALAKIPSSSVYAKLLQGGIAANEHLTDDALQLLLPLQTEKQFIPEASTALHLYLAATFEHLDDTEQTINHLIQAESTLSSAQTSSAEDSISVLHERIWQLLNRLAHTALSQLRGTTTDNIVQGWIDLCLALRSPDITQASTQWRTLYPDHPALAFANRLVATTTAFAPLKEKLSSNGSIALIMPLASGAPDAAAEAYKAGLQTALTSLGMQNQINLYPATESQQNIDDIYTLAKSEGNAYFIIPSFSSSEVDSKQMRLTEGGNVIQVGPLTDDEALHIAAYAISRHLQKITVVTLENGTFNHLVNNFQAAWQSHPEYAPDKDTLQLVTLPENISASDNSLLDLKSLVEQNAPDMILLALPAAFTRAVRPHLPISIPTITFSHANERTSDTVTYSTLNAVRLFDIPFIINQGSTFSEAYQQAAANLDNNALIRWFALGADSLQLLIAAETRSEREIAISGLTGTLTINTIGTIQRQLPLARFTHKGVTLEQ